MQTFTEKSTIYYRLLPTGIEDIHISNIGFDDFHVTKPLYTPRVQSEYTLHFILGGKGRIVVEGQEYTAEKNLLFFIRPGERFCYFPIPDDPWDYVWFGFTGKMADFYLSLLTFGNERCRAARFPDRLRDLFSRLFSKGESGGIDETDALAAFFMLFSIEKRGVTGEGNRRPRLSERAISLIKMNLKNPDFRIRTLADMMHLCHSYLTRVFRTEVGVSPDAYLIGERLSLAASMLTGTDLPIAAISEQCGYRDEIHFAKSFRHLYGVSPRAFRAEHNNR